MIYYIISTSGEKIAKEGTWSAIAGMWLSTFILGPLAAFLIYKATNDSNLLNVEWYYNHVKKFVDRFMAYIDPILTKLKPKKRIKKQ